MPNNDYKALEINILNLSIGAKRRWVLGLWKGYLNKAIKQGGAFDSRPDPQEDKDNIIVFCHVWLKNSYQFQYIYYNALS